MAEGALHVGEIAEYVGVVELKIVEHRDVRRIVDELAALVEKRAVVFVALDDERVSRRAKMAAGRRILRHAADEIAGVAVVFAQQERRQRSRGGFPVRAANDDIATFFQNELMEHRRQRGERQRAGVEQPLDLRIAARHGVADDREIGRKFSEPHRIVALVHSDAGFGQHRAHRRINARIGAKHFVAGGARQQRGVAHRRCRKFP